MNALDHAILETHKINSPVGTSHQSAIGWRLFTHGFLTRRWHTLLHSTKINNSHSHGGQHPEIETTKTITGIIKTMWAVLGRAWLDHLATVHQTASLHQSPVTLSSLQDRVRLIHALRHSETLPIHHHYFHDDLESVLKKATIQSLTTYIQHYLPVIMRSINLRSEATYTLVHMQDTTPHSERNRTSNTTPLLSPTTTHSNFSGSQSDNTAHELTNTTRQLHHPAQEEPAHRKQSR
jgi:hypothetical protein